MEEITKLHGAKWIGAPDYRSAEDRLNILVYFRKKFDLTKPGRMNLAISANNRYKLWINGQKVCVGPCKGDQWRHYYEVIDVSSYLKTGENVIAVEVLYYKPALYRDLNKGGPMGVVSNAFGPMLIVKGECISEEGELLADITTGKCEWYSCVDEAVKWQVYDIDFTPIGTFEIVEGNKLPTAWKTCLSPAEGSWVPAIDRWAADGSTFGEFSPLPLTERTIPFMFEKVRPFIREMVGQEDSQRFSFSSEASITLVPGKDSFIELDAGELTTGYVCIKTIGGAGSRISITYAESYSLPRATRVQYASKGIRDDCVNYKLRGYHDEFLPSGGKDAYEPFWYRTFRFIGLKVEVGEEPLTLFRPEYVETGYPLEIKSCIESPSEFIKPLWDISIRTLKRCMHETYEDCPYYEQLQYSMDTRLEILFTYMVSGDTRLALKALEDFYSSLTPEGLLQSRAPSDEPNLIPVFSLYWIFMVEDYYWQTGDAGIIKRYRPAIDSILDWFERKIGSYGLTEKYFYWEFVDWVEEWKDKNGSPNGVPPACAKGPSATNNLIYSAALESAATLMEITGRSQVAQEYRNKAREIKENVDKYCWCEQKGMYREGPEYEEYTQHAQAWAVLSGLAHNDRAGLILNNCLMPGSAECCTFVFSFFLFRALEKAGLYQLTVPLWDKWKDALRVNLTTWPEDLSNQRSDCHGWGALPLYEFTRCVLGVQPAEPGWERIKIEPLDLSLPGAKGEVITNKGIVKVEWNKINGILYLKGYVPEGVPFDVILPDGRVYHHQAGGGFDYSAY